MKVAVIGSRNLIVKNIGEYLPENIDEIISGGAKGIDTCAKNFAIANKIKLTEILPDYENFGRSAPLKRNLQIIDYADAVIAFWDGKSRGTEYVINNCKKNNVPYILYLYKCLDLDDYPIFEVEEMMF